MEILKLNEPAIAKAVKVIHDGGLVIFPSDTVYGALVDSTNALAVKKLTLFKNRPPGKPISVFLNKDMLKEYVKINTHQQSILDQLLPGPFTLILSSTHKVNSLLESEKSSLGIRIPDYPSVIRITKDLRKAITATSANLSGRSAHYSIDSLIKEFPQSKQNMIDLIIDAGKLPHNKPSTIIDLTESRLKVLRQGDVGVKDLKTFISKNESETKKIALFLIKSKLKYVEDKPLIFIIEGEMGVGKTVFVKGAGQYFDIGNITSPTYVVSYEYAVNKREIKRFIHCDLFNIEESDEFNYLGLEQYIKPGNVILMEWGEKAGEFYDMLKKRGKIVHIKMEYRGEKEREIRIW